MKNILVLTGPSAVGKTSVMSEILSVSDDFAYSRSATTRSARGDGRDSEYEYVTEEEFKARIASGEMLEYTVYGGNYYGTPCSEIERIFGMEKKPLLVLDINGVISLKKSKYSDSIFAVYLWDDLSVLEARLKERIPLSAIKEDGIAIFERRVSENIADYERIKTLDGVFDAFVKNSNIRESAEAVLNLIK